MVEKKEEFEFDQNQKASKEKKKKGGLVPGRQSKKVQMSFLSGHVLEKVPFPGRH